MPFPCFRYINEDRESALEKIQENLSAVDNKIRTVDEERGRLSSQIDELKDDISRQKVRQFSL